LDKADTKANTNTKQPEQVVKLLPLSPPKLKDPVIHKNCEGKKGADPNITNQ
jgi:hypothetical protein